MPPWVVHLFSIILGLIIGSFLNVVILRLPVHESVVHPGSRCPQCKSPIRWWDNIPVLSYLALVGKCRHCKNPISIRYPVIELITALLFLATEMTFGWNLSLFIRNWPFVAILTAITFIDLEHRIIPDSLSLGGLFIGLSTCWLTTAGIIQSISGAVVGFAFFYSIAWLYQRFSGRSGLGGGDVKLLAMIGAFIGPYGVLITVFISSILGSLIGIFWAMMNGQKQVMKQAIPFGPFLVLGALYYYLLGDLWLQFMTPM